MSNPNVKPSSRFVLMATIDPDVTVASTVTSDWVSMEKFESAVGEVLMGTLGASATVNAKFEQASDSGGTGAKDVTDSDITEQTQAGTDASDKQVIINIQSSALDVANSFNHIRLSVTVGVATSDMCATVHGCDPRYDNPATDLASVVEIVTL